MLLPTLRMNNNGKSMEETEIILQRKSQCYIILQFNKNKNVFQDFSSCMPDQNSTYKIKPSDLFPSNFKIATA